MPATHTFRHGSFALAWHGLPPHSLPVYPPNLPTSQPPNLLTHTQPSSPPPTCTTIWRLWRCCGLVRWTHWRAWTYCWCPRRSRTGRRWGRRGAVGRRGRQERRAGEVGRRGRRGPEQGHGETGEWRGRARLCRRCQDAEWDCGRTACTDTHLNTHSRSPSATNASPAFPAPQDPVPTQ